MNQTLNDFLADQCQQQRPGSSEVLKGFLPQTAGYRSGYSIQKATEKGYRQGGCQEAEALNVHARTPSYCNCLKPAKFSRLQSRARKLSQAHTYAHIAILVARISLACTVCLGSPQFGAPWEMPCVGTFNVPCARIHRMCM